MRPLLSLLTAAVLVATTPANAVAAPDATDWNALAPDGIVLFRHATAPGVGDPANFSLGDCTTQRNLDATGRTAAAAIGDASHAHGIRVGMVLSSQWCRTRETADLAFPGRATAEPVFNSFFDHAAGEAQQTAAARALLAHWKGPGVLVVVTHQVNITALTGVVPGPGEGVVVEPSGNGLKVVGRIAAGR